MYRYSNPDIDEKLDGQRGVLWQHDVPRLFVFDSVNRFICNDIIVWNPQAWMLLPNPIMPGEDGVDYRSYADWRKAGRCVAKGQKSHKRVNGVAMFSFAQTTAMTFKTAPTSQIDNIGTQPAIIPSRHDNPRNSEDGLGQVGIDSYEGTGGATCAPYLAEPDPFREEGDCN